MNLPEVRFCRFALAIVLTIGTSFSSLILAQTCNGYLGANIYKQGDFGSGQMNIIPIDPKIAPGYRYVSNPPPQDGTYIITNDINKWSKGYNWLKIQDNSTDTNGYMMVVNASFNPGLFLELPINDLCENTLYEFSADLINLIIPGDNLIKPKINFLIGDDVSYNTGNVPEDAKWHTYRFEFLTKPGQTSVVLKLENDAPGGYGNDLAIDNISFRPCGPKATIWPRGVSKVCNEHFTPYKLEAVLEGNQYKTPFIQWQHSINRGLSWTDVKDSVGSTFYHNNNKRGFYYYRYIVGNSADYVRNSKCRVTSKTKVIEVLPTFYSIADTICAGVAYPFGGRALTQSGTYSDSLISAYGCDSVVLLELFVDPDINIKATFKVTNPSCDYLNDGQIDIVNVINAKPPLMFYLNSLQSNESDFKNLAARSHQYRIVDRIGCNFDTSILLKKPEPFIIDLEPDADVKLGQSVQLVTTSNNAITHYEWSNRQDIDCEINCSPVEFYPPETMHVVLTATSDKKCSAKDSVRIQIEVARNIFLANTFSPNGDGLNEIFTPSTLYPQVKEFDKFTIFNRWGQVIYNVEHINPNDIAASWDGTDANPGIYAYYLEARFLDDVVLKFRGTLHLIR